MTSVPDLCKIILVLVKLEAMQTRAWEWKDNMADVVKTEAVKRVRLEGWDATHPALATTVRCVFSLAHSNKLTESHRGKSMVYASIYGMHPRWPARHCTKVY